MDLADLLHPELRGVIDVFQLPALDDGAALAQDQQPAPETPPAPAQPYKPNPGTVYFP